jgi:hypothetical protein
MKSLRKLHLYLGCAFAPLILYFALSGVWQTFRLNDIDKDHPSVVHSFFHELSKPHKDATLPGKKPDDDYSTLFVWASAAMGAGLAATTLLGIAIAVQSARKRMVLVCLALGTALPIAFLFLH